MKARIRFRINRLLVKQKRMSPVIKIFRSQTELDAFKLEQLQLPEHERPEHLLLIHRFSREPSAPVASAPNV